MSPATWNKTLEQFEDTQRRLQQMKSAEPTPSAKLCRESAHRTLGHLTVCQTAWLHLMRHLQNGDLTGTVPVNPDPLYRQLGFSRSSWDSILSKFIADRAEWRSILSELDLSRELKTSRRSWTAQTLTKRMVDHERRHLDDLS